MRFLDELYKWDVNYCSGMDGEETGGLPGCKSRNTQIGGPVSLLKKPPDGKCPLHNEVECEYGKPCDTDCNSGCRDDGDSTSHNKIHKKGPEGYYADHLYKTWTGGPPAKCEWWCDRHHASDKEKCAWGTRACA